MQKIIAFEIPEVALSPEQVALALNKACSGRQGRYRISGVCQIEDTALFVLLPLARGRALEEYLFCTVSDLTVPGFTGALLDRWSHGFNTLGALAVGNARVLLLARPKGRAA